MKLLVILVSFVIVLTFLAILATLLERYWRNYQAERAAAKQDDLHGHEQTTSQNGINPLIGSVTSWINQLQSLLQPKKSSSNPSKQFREWVKRDLTQEPGLQSWLLALPEPGFDLLTEHIANFCNEMNFELKWLVTQEFAVVPELEAALKRVIVNYCNACQQAVPAQQQLNLFTEYHRLIQTAPGRQEQLFQRTLYANLADQGMVAPPAPAEFIAATESERQQKARQGIQQAAAKDWSQFAQILQTTMLSATPRPASSNKGNQSAGQDTAVHNGSKSAKKQTSEQKTA